MDNRPEDTGFYRILVAIETDATRFYGSNASRPGLLSQTDSEQMLAHIASDLKSLLPDISRCSLIAAGALFDQTQVLRPSYPVFKALEAVSTNDKQDQFKPGLVSVGARDGIMPSPELQPLADIPLGLLQLLPLVIQGPASLVDELGQAMEYRFIDQGQLSAHSSAWLETAFGIAVNHARLMTLTDLNAMFRLQLDHFGFLPLWELLDAAMTGCDETIRVTTSAGQSFRWEDGAIHTVFETFDSWASNGKGAEVAAERQALSAGYGDWTREIRRFLTTLNAHGLDVRFYRAGQNEPMDGTFFKESSESNPGTGEATITEHSYSELGTIAVTVRDKGRVDNYYPLCPRGLNDIQTHIRTHVPGVHSVAFPGTILHDERTRKLVPDAGNFSARR